MQSFPHKVSPYTATALNRSLIWFTVGYTIQHISLGATKITRVAHPSRVSLTQTLLHNYLNIAHAGQIIPQSCNTYTHCIEVAMDLTKGQLGMIFLTFLSMAL